MPGIWNENEAKGWLKSDDSSIMLELPRRIAAAVIAHEGTVDRIMDIASGPGTFMKVFLDAFPNSVGIWNDASQVMKDQAQVLLAPYADRIQWYPGDMNDIGNFDGKGELDAVLTSRASHHLSVEELESFYRQVSSLLKPGGWVVNLDHIYLNEPWDTRFRTTRKELFRKSSASADEGSGHKHERKAPELKDHYSALEKAGISEICVGWQAFYTVLLLGRKPTN